MIDFSKTKINDIFKATLTGLKPNTPILPFVKNSFRQVMANDINTSLWYTNLPDADQDKFIKQYPYIVGIKQLQNGEQDNAVNDLITYLSQQAGGGRTDSPIDRIHNATKDAYTKAIELKNIEIAELESRRRQAGGSPESEIYASAKKVFNATHLLDAATIKEEEQIIKTEEKQIQQLTHERDDLQVLLNELSAIIANQNQAIEQQRTQLKQQKSASFSSIPVSQTSQYLSGSPSWQNKTSSALKQGQTLLNASRAASFAKAEAAKAQKKGNVRRSQGILWGQEGGAYTPTPIRGPEELPDILEEQEAWSKANDAYNNLDPTYKTLLPPPEPAPISSLATPFQNYINNEADPEALEEARDSLGMVSPEEIEDYINNDEYENEMNGNAVSQRVAPMYQTALPRVKPEWVSIMIRADILQQLLQNKNATVDGIRQI